MWRTTSTARPSRPPARAAWPPWTRKNIWTTTAEASALIPDIPALLDPLAPRFPDPETALADPDGLLAVGGNLQPTTLLDAYSRGIFPWYEQGQPVLWWSPGQRAVLTPGQEHLSRSLRKCFRRGGFSFTTDRAFERVIAACAAPRAYATGTWITPAMVRAYTRLHRLGHAHSLECWRDGELAGGLYGVQVGGLFCGESMFSARDNASKAAFIVLARTLFRAGFGLIDCQLDNPHLASLGANTLSRRDFLALLPLLKTQRIPWPDQAAFNATSAMLQGQRQD